LKLQTNREKASGYYDKAMRHTTDPLMDIYANLNKAKMLKAMIRRDRQKHRSTSSHVKKR
jgi:hypothetical protein